MAYGDNFRDEPNYNRGSYNDVADENSDYERTPLQHYDTPKEPGFYFVNIPDAIRKQYLRANQTFIKSRGKYNGIAFVFGGGSFLKVKVWDFVAHTTFFGNAPHLLQWSEKVEDASIAFGENFIQ